MEKINGRIDMETKESVPTVGSVYNSFTDEQKPMIHFLAGCVIEKIEDENKYEDFKTNVLHVDRLSDYIYPVPLIWSDSNPDTNCDNTLGSVFKSFTFDQKTVIEFLIGNIILGITDEEEYESLKQNTSHVKYLRYVRVLKGFGFFKSEGFYD